MVVFIHPNLFTEDISFEMFEPYDNIYVKHYLNDFLSIWILVRFYLVVRIILNSSMYADTRANRICRLYGCEPGYFYAAKCYM